MVNYIEIKLKDIDIPNRKHLWALANKAFSDGEKIDYSDYDSIENKTILEYELDDDMAKNKVVQAMNKLAKGINKNIKYSLDDEPEIETSVKLDNREERKLDIMITKLLEKLQAYYNIYDKHTKKMAEEEKMKKIEQLTEQYGDIEEISGSMEDLIGEDLLNTDRDHIKRIIEFYVRYYCLL